MTIFPHGEAPSVAVVEFGDPAPGVRRQVTELYEAEFGVPVTELGSTPLPDAVSGDAGVIDAEELLDAADPGDDAYDFVLGVTDRELKHGTRYGIFGLWFQGGRAGVLSTAGLVDGEPDEPPARTRLRKVVLKGAGCLFGFGYHEDCVMSESSTVDNLDAKPGEFCDDCARRLRGAETAPEPPEWHAVTPELEEFGTAQRWAEGDVRLAEYPVLALGLGVLVLQRAGSALRLDRALRAAGKFARGVARGSLALSSVTLPRPVRAFVHETYRLVRFSWRLLTFVLAYVVVAGGLGTMVGPENASTVEIWLILAGSLLGAYVLSGLANGLLAGIVEGLGLGVRGLETEE